jgi:hypothetical protein
MKYKDYIKYLKSKNIILFDHDYRISYNNIKIYYNINNLNNNHNLIGGGNTNHQNNNNNNDIHYDIHYDIHTIINLALSSNPQYLLNYQSN